MTQNAADKYPKTASILALVGGILMILSGALLVFVSAVILPNVVFPNVNTPPQIPPESIHRIASGVVGGMGLFGLVSGAIVLASSVILLTTERDPRTWGILILVFSVLSFLGLGGFIAGAVLGLIGGIMALRWKPPTQ